MRKNDHRPCVPELQDPAVVNAALTQNLWYTVLDTVYNPRVIILSFAQLTANEDLEIRITTERGAETLTQTAVAGTIYYIMMNDGSFATTHFEVTTTTPGPNKTFILECQQIKVEIRKTSAAGANNTQCRVVYGLWRR